MNEEKLKSEEQNLELNLTQFYPDVWRYIDSCSVKYQNDYFRFQKLQSIILICIPLFVILSVTLNYDFPMAILPFLLLVVLVLINTLLPAEKYALAWQITRSVSESIKREVWLYFMSCDSFGTGTPAKTSDSRSYFISTVTKLVKSLDIKCGSIQGDEKGGFYVTDYIDKMRLSDTMQKFDYYKRYRMDDQINWYKNKSNRNGLLGKNFYLSMLIVIFISLALSLVLGLIYHGYLEVIDLLVAIILSLQSYGNSKRFIELEYTYKNTFLELKEIKERAESPSADETCKIVKLFELAISREHEIWRYRHGAKA